MCREARVWREQAGTIPDPFLRRLALEAQHTKRGNLEGAAAFAAFAPAAHRGTVTRAQVAFQAIYDYVDTLAEQPASDPIANGRHLHHALLIALYPNAAHLDYYTHNPQGEDDGYLARIIDTCRTALEALPSYTLVAVPARRAAARIVSYQSLNLREAQGGQTALARWAQQQTPHGTGLRWWETAASAGSSLEVFVLIAVAANPTVHVSEITAIENTYFPWVGSLHSLLDSLIDLPEDAASGQRSLLDNYTSPHEAAERMTWIATHAARLTRSLPNGHEHLLVLTSMTSFYLSTPGVSALPISRDILAAVDSLATPAKLLFSARRAAARTHQRQKDGDAVE